MLFDTIKCSIGLFSNAGFFSMCDQDILILTFKIQSNLNILNWLCMSVYVRKSLFDCATFSWMESFFAGCVGGICVISFVSRNVQKLSYIFKLLKAQKLCMNCILMILFCRWAWSFGWTSSRYNKGKMELTNVYKRPHSL